MYVRFKRRQRKAKTVAKVVEAGADRVPAGVSPLIRDELVRDGAVELHYTLDAVVGETARVNGVPRQRQLAHLGSIDERTSGWASERWAFWRVVDLGLADFAERFGPEAEAAMRDAVEAKVPRPPETAFVDPFEWRVLHETYGQHYRRLSLAVLPAIEPHLAPGDAAGRYVVAGHGGHHDNLRRIATAHPADSGVAAIVTVAEKPGIFGFRREADTIRAWCDLVGLPLAMPPIPDRLLETLLTPAAKRATYRLPLVKSEASPP